MLQWNSEEKQDVTRMMLCKIITKKAYPFWGPPAGIVD
jgi:hypothetical protein